MGTVSSNYLTSFLGVLRNAPVGPSASSPASELGRAFAAACGYETPEKDGKLQQATIVFVKQLMLEGRTPEQVVIAIKEALTRHGGCKTPPSFHAAGWDIDTRQARAYRRVFGWCLDTYFGPWAKRARVRGDHPR